ncbi:nodulation protein NfeD [bacterium]|nr:nodulation protein NfeD [bacterium]
MKRATRRGRVSRALAPLAFATAFVLAAALTGAMLSPAAAQPSENAEAPVAAGERSVLVVSIENMTINPGSSDYLRAAIIEAEARRSEALVIELDTPGGLVDSTRDIVKEFLASPVPVIVYVTPPGARAGSAGVMITLASHIAAMAPGTNIGAAHPVAGGGQEIGEEMNKKITNDTVAWVEGIAEQRGRNREWAVKAVRDSVSVTATDALEKKVIDFVATNLDDVLAKADGRTVTLGGGIEKTLATKGALVMRRPPGLKHRLIMRLADPNLAYIFMMIGFLGIYAEFSHPGLIFPGVIGAVCFLLFLMSTQILPINVVGVILIVVGLALFIAEVQVTSYGLLTLGGAISLALGSLFLFDVPEKVVDPDYSFSVSPAIVLPVTVGFALAVGLITWMVVRVHRRRPQTGAESIVGTTGVVTTAIDPLAGGQVKLAGEFWHAKSAVPVEAGAIVRVVAVKGAHIEVTPA